MAKTKKKSVFPMVALRGKVIFPNVESSFDVGRLLSLTAISRSSEQQTMNLFVAAQRDMSKDEITADDVYRVGTVVSIRQIAKLPSNNLRVSVEGLYRAKAEEVYEEDGCLYALVSELNPVHGDEMLEEAYFRTSKEIVKDIGATDGRISKEGITALEKCSSAEEFVNMTGHYMQLRTELRINLNPKTPITK